MLIPDGPFLTDLDERQRIKGSRDPLGAQRVWTHFGRKVVGNLTTVSSSLRDFTTLLVGAHLAARAARDVRPEEFLPTFLKWEQLAAYSRYKYNKGTGLRGSDRVEARCKSGSRLVLSAQPEDQLLSDQRAYGIWGLYSGPANASGLLDGDPSHLAVRAARKDLPSPLEFVEKEYLPKLKKAFPGHNGDGLFAKLLRPRTSLSPDDACFAAAAAIYRDELTVPEKAFYREHLVAGGPEDGERTNGRQRVFSGILARLEQLRAEPLSPGHFEAFAREAEKAGASDLAADLERILHCESVLAPAGAFFSFMLTMHGKTVEATAKAVRETWGSRVSAIRVPSVRDMESEFRISSGDDAAKRWVAIGDALHSGDYREAATLLVRQNAETMKGRNAAAWLEIEQGGRLKVSLADADELAGLPSKEELPRLWRYTYFVDSLWSIVHRTGPAS